jgi:hypothetical protein
MKIDVFCFVVGPGLDVRGSEISTIGGESSLHDVRRLAYVFFDDFASEVDAVAEVFGGVDFDGVDAVVAGVSLWVFALGSAFYLLLDLLH